MTVGNASDVASSERSGLFYVRLQNLPVNATQKLIRDFFSDLAILDGGISIHQNFSIVVFDNEKDAAAALSRDYELIDGKKVHIRNAGHYFLKDVQRARVKAARKKLVFGPPEKMTMVKQKKRIRPTKVKDCSAVVASKRFCPDEIEFPTKNRMKSLTNIKNDGFKISDEAIMGNCLKSHDDKVDGGESEPYVFTEPITKNELYPHDKVPKHFKSASQIRSNVNKDEVNLKDEKNVKNATESCFVKKFNSAKIESRNLEENAVEQEHTWRFLDEKVLNNKNEISYTYENNSAKSKLEGKVNGQASDSEFPKKVRDVTNKFPTKKTIKPTSVLTLNLFKMAHEGTVF